MCLSAAGSKAICSLQIVSCFSVELKTKTIWQLPSERLSPMNDRSETAITRPGPVPGSGPTKPLEPNPDWPNPKVSPEGMSADRVDELVESARTALAAMPEWRKKYIRAKMSAALVVGVTNGPR